MHSSFIDNILGVNLADMQLISKFNKGIQFLLHVIYIYSKYVLVASLKDKKGINAFKKTFMNLFANQTKYGWMKELEFTIGQ